MKTLNELQKEREHLAQELAEVTECIEEKKQEQAELTPAHALAEELHAHLCHHNHTDGCGWFYDNWHKQLADFSARKKYLEMAQRMLEIADLETILAIVECI